VALAAGRAVHIAGLKLGAVCAGVAFDWLLIPWCQARYGNGGIGVVLAGIGSELVMLVGLFRWMPRGVIEARIFVDLGRSLLAGGATVLAVRLLPVASPLLTLPLCLVAFAVAAAAVGLLRRSDLDALRAALRRRQKIAAATAAATPAPGEGTGATIHGR